MLKSAYLKIEEYNPLALEGFKLTTECLAGVVVSVNRGESYSAVENFEKYHWGQWYQSFNGGCLIGRKT